MTTRLNKTNIPVIEKFIIKSYNVKSQAREKYKNFLSIIDVWDIEIKLEKKYKHLKENEIINIVAKLVYN